MSTLIALALALATLQPAESPVVASSVDLCRDQPTTVVRLASLPTGARFRSWGRHYINRGRDPQDPGFLLATRLGDDYPAPFSDSAMVEITTTP